MRQSAWVRAPLSRCVIARACGVPRTQDTYGLQWADIARVLSVALSCVASSLVATPKNQRKPDSASLRSFAEQRYLARCVAPQDIYTCTCTLKKHCPCTCTLFYCPKLRKSILNRVATVSWSKARIHVRTFWGLQSVLQFRTVAKGAHISLVYCVHRPTDCILPGP